MGDLLRNLYKLWQGCTDQAPNNFAVWDMFGMRVPQSSNCEWVILFPNLLNVACLLGLSSRPIEE